MIALGWVVAIGLPLAVTVGVIVWPERIPKDRTTREIRERSKREDTSISGQTSTGTTHLVLLALLPRGLLANRRTREQTPPGKSEPRTPNI